MSLTGTQSGARKRKTGHKDDDDDHLFLGDPVSPEGRPSRGARRFCDVIYYLFMFLFTLATLIIVILILIKLHTVEDKIDAIKVCLEYLKNCAEYIKQKVDYIIECLEPFKVTVLDCLEYIKGCLEYIKGCLTWIKSKLQEQAMELAPYECNDYNQCTIDFIKQGACMNLPVHCAPFISKKGEKPTDKNICPPINCHDKCFDDPILIAKNDNEKTLKSEAANTVSSLVKRNGPPNGECGHGHSLGLCVPQTQCKGTCDPNPPTTAPPMIRDEVVPKNGQCEAYGCPSLNFLPVFFNPPGCECSSCHRCEYHGTIRLFDQYYHVPVGPLVCQDKTLLEEKCLAAISDEDYHKSCLRATAICEPLAKKKNGQVDVDVKCIYSFACAKPVLSPILIKK